MGRARQKYAPGRVGARPDLEEMKKVKTDFDGKDLKGIDPSNALVLPSRRDDSRRKIPQQQNVPKKLSKKQRKKLEKVIDQKKKKEKRAELLELLSNVQVDSAELAMLDSVAHLGTKNSKLSRLSKRPLTEDQKIAIENQSNESVDLKGWQARRKRRKLTKREKSPLKEKSPPPSSSESEESSSDDQEDEISSCDEDVEAKELEESETTKACEVNANSAEDKKPEEPILESDFKKTNCTSSKEKLEVQPATYVHVERTPEIQESRLLLPILAEEQEIMEAVKEHLIIIVCGQTGSGKTTQVPQFLFEAGFAKDGIIGITEPRRVAAVSMSKRVATEMNLSTNIVSYQIRYENNVTSETSIKFMTDGVLTRELKEDFLLSKYSVIILDEAHERTSNTDVLIGLLSRIVPLRKKKGNPLKLIIMSATLRIEDFTKNERLFKTSPPVVKIDVRQFPVTVHFNKKTPISDDDITCPYLDEAYRKICKIHRTLPSGGILVFVTGRQEVHALMRKLNSKFPKKNNEARNQEKSKLQVLNLDNYEAKPRDDLEEDDRTRRLDLSEDEDGSSGDELMMEDDALTSEMDSSIPLHVLPLYSLLSSEKQRQVFAPVPEGTRLCVVATNVAETSLTIPGIKYVVDTGKVKRKLYDKITGVSSFRVTWVSKASANQRAGRAGRTEPGHAYRLYSSAVFQDFDEFDKPEIETKPVAGLVLQMKSMKIDRVINFPFPTPPPHEALESAEKLLISLGAIRVLLNRGTLKEMKQAQFSGTITDLGHRISAFPVHPRFGKMITMATKHIDIIPYVITVVAGLTVREIFFTPSHDPDNDANEEQNRQLRARLSHLKSLWSSVGGGPERKLLGDLMVLLGAIGSAEYSGATPSFCVSNCLRPKAIIEVRKLRAQLTGIVRSSLGLDDVIIDPKMEPPSDEQVRLLRKIVLSGLGDHVARKISMEEIPSERRKEWKGAYQSLLLDEPVFIHPESVLSRDPLPTYVIFQDLMEALSGKKSYIRDISSIEPEWLAHFCPHYCHFSKPLDLPEPRYDVTTDQVKCHVTASYGRLSWSLGAVEIDFPAGIDRYRWFGRFLLEGLIMTSLKSFVTSLLSRPAVMTKSWSNLQPRTEKLLQDLMRRQVDSREKLLGAWKEDSSFLRDAIMDWIPSSLHPQLLLSWPPT
ncbi:unnamed protein product [Clavelina lepadiformis]|uniref:RNA helicase n=1 Tax=Clavelina lepadiformis TaxID=159417 RepID=A0ABP0GJ17_CLALP